MLKFDKISVIEYNDYVYILFLIMENLWNIDLSSVLQWVEEPKVTYENKVENIEMKFKKDKINIVVSRSFWDRFVSFLFFVARCVVVFVLISVFVWFNTLVNTISSIWNMNLENITTSVWDNLDIMQALNVNNSLASWSEIGEYLDLMNSLLDS